MTVAWWQNIPLFLIVLPLMGAAVCSVCRGRAARAVTAALCALDCAALGLLLVCTAQSGESFIYPMGEIGAPFGNELRVGLLEALVGFGFSLIVLCAVLGGWKRLGVDVPPNRMNLYGAMLCLLLSAMAAITFTNDLFTAYVFIEITTIAACALICATNRGRTLFAATRYMIMNLLGSGLFLLGLSMLYGLTGHLLFPQLGQAVQRLLDAGSYPAPLYLSFILMTMGVAMKSALYPFHTWLPNAYASATPTSSALLSSVISKMYIFLLIKILLRAAGTHVFARRIEDVLFLYAVAGIVMGSVHAIRQRRFSRMIAYSSVSQIGYIFLGIALGTQEGFAAAVFHILAHSAAKSMLFLSANKLREASDGADSFEALRGAGFRAPLAGAAFTVGACSLVGIPLLGGFASKVFLAQAGAALGGVRMIAVLLTLAVSTALHVAYLLRALLSLYRGGRQGSTARSALAQDPPFAWAVGLLILVNFLLGCAGGNVFAMIRQGLDRFI